ncbi:MAG: delta-60 repeat domain-containing protein, partial [Bacteroidia bacterium]|nr:delta-60 repeat domain-containing protein [Bacteroidia bacterium]
MNRIVLFLFCLFSSFLYAQPGTNDSLFNVLDQGFSNGLGPNDQLRAVALQADGKVLVGGFFTKFNEKNINRIARLKEGVLDTSFKVGTGFSDYVQCIALQADGKIIVGGNFTSYGGTNRNRIVRLNTDGSLDLSFNIGAGFNGLVRKLIVLPDGKILAFGNFTSYRGIPRNFIVRINTNGTVDTDFNSGANGTIYDAFVQPDSKIVIGGGFTLYDGIIKERIARINSDGSLDSNFAIGFAFNTTVYALKPYRKGKILVGGEFINFQGVSRNKIALIDSLGNLDLAFDPSLGFSSGVYSLLVQTDGKIIASGSFVSYRGISCGKVARLDSLAGLDTTYLSGSGITGGTTITVYESVMDSLGRTIFVGSFANYSNKSRNHLVRTYPDGKPDYALNEPTGFNAIPRNFLVQPDGKILCVGDFKLVHGKEFASIVRLNMAGTPDTSFSIGTGFNDELSGYYANVLALQKDGKILVGGNFINFNGKQVASIIRLFPNGILDTSFISNNYNEIINDIEILDDGRILIAGDFGSYQGKMQKKIARLLPNGILDTTFLVNPGFDNAVKDILIQPDGKILAAGNFNEYNNQYLNTRIIRLNENGLIDSSFNFNNTIVGGINSIGLQPDGKVVIAGIFTSVNGVSRNRIARLNSDGTFDNSFYPGSSSFNGIANKILVQADGSILVIGAFTQFNTSPQSRIARL